MYRRIFLPMAVLYVLLIVLVLRWAYQEPTVQLHEEVEYINATLEKLLVPRYHGSPGHARVRHFLEEELQRVGFVTTREEYVVGVNFTNVVGFWNQNASQIVVLTCHYDSQPPEKGQEKVDLVSATEGATSCAILLDLAKTLGSAKQGLGLNGDIGLALVFFDGHESPATKPANNPPLHGSRLFVMNQNIPFYLIKVVITLNYIGAPNQIFPSYYQDTNDIYNQIADIEKELRESGQLVHCHVLFQRTFPLSYGNDLPDDHLPFNDEDLFVMHIAPQNYPAVRHKAADNAENLHWPTIQNMIKILRKFIDDYVVNQDLYSLDQIELYEY